jgi:hypothetical protein
MKIAVMQPYFFPYIGYFQLVSSVDRFVFFDDVNFIKKGWINRNRILQNNEVHTFSIPLSGMSQNKKISETALAEPAAWNAAFLKTLSISYKRAPFFDETYALIERVLTGTTYASIAELASASVRAVLGHVGLTQLFESSSAMAYSGMNGQEKILSICNLLHASAYVNPANGAFQYEEEDFKKAGVDLFFLKAEIDAYAQWDGRAFEPALSVIDVLMFNDRETVKQMFAKGTLVSKSQL